MSAYHNRLSELSSEVLKINPAARVTSCSFGQVPLHEVLDVEAPRTDIQGVSHEVQYSTRQHAALGGS